MGGSSFQDVVMPPRELHMPRVAHTVAYVASWMPPRRLAVPSMPILVLLGTSWLNQEELQMMLVARPHPSILVAPSASIIDLRTMSRKTFPLPWHGQLSHQLLVFPYDVLHAQRTSLNRV